MSQKCEECKSEKHSICSNPKERDDCWECCCGFTIPPPPKCPREED